MPIAVPGRFRAGVDDEFAKTIDHSGRPRVWAPRAILQIHKEIGKVQASSRVLLVLREIIQLEHRSATEACVDGIEIAVGGWRKIGCRGHTAVSWAALVRLLKADNPIGERLGLCKYLRIGGGRAREQGQEADHFAS